uniref:Uncharacterized protein n=1 Tax=Rhizophora mucronata TaxID=61149 RepID=A0A2P2Q6E7_RHIMU
MHLSGFLELFLMVGCLSLDPTQHIFRNLLSLKEKDRTTVGDNEMG